LGFAALKYLKFLPSTALIYTVVLCWKDMRLKVNYGV